MTDKMGSNQQIALKDGRALGYAEYGDEDGEPVFFFHGFPGSRLDWRMFTSGDGSGAPHARIIAPDRPGMGLSDFQRGRRILDWPDDVLQLADALDVEAFSVLAVSGGGPYGLACAYKIPDRLSAVAIVSGMGPADAPGARDGTSWTYPGKPALLRRMVLFLTRMGLSKPERMADQIKSSFSGADADLMNEHPELIEEIIGSWREAMRAGLAGVSHEAGLYTEPWGYRLIDIEMPVVVWHGGDQDRNVLTSVGRHVADALPESRARLFENEGHFSLARKHLDEIMPLLVTQA